MDLENAGLGISTNLMNYLIEGNKKPDGLLHCSGLAQCEYSQIQQAMGELKEGKNELIDLTVMHTGTMWHKVLQDSDENWIWCEQDMSPYMPEGWSGSIDGIKKLGDWRVLLDVKTMNGEGMRYIKGVKPEHRWQVSAYYWSVERYFLANGVKSKLYPKAVIFYMPVSRAKDYTAEPVEVWFDPIPKDIVLAEMQKRAADLQFYKETGENLGSHMPPTINVKRAAGGFRNIYIGPNWWINYCPAKDCPCAKEQTRNRRIGTMDPGGNITSIDPDYSAEHIGRLVHGDG